ncbi:hypothetical protein, partial [Neobacillus niacini]|uniref:hypothetical protein n=1 Tax=Neobacillus niacini TaxID=86668 RepID=UPI002FFFF35A
MTIEFIKKHLTKIGVLLPIVSLVFGVIIINLFLNQFGIVEYSIFQIQSVLTGSVYLLTMYMLIVYFNWVLIKFKKYTFMMFIASIFSSILITTVFYHLFITEYTKITLFQITFTPNIIKG